MSSLRRAFRTWIPCAQAAWSNSFASSSRRTLYRVRCLLVRSEAAGVAARTAQEREMQIFLSDSIMIDLVRVALWL